MLIGVLYGLAACLVWGTVYVAPLVLSNFPPIFIALVRYAVFGALSLGMVLPSIFNNRLRVAKSDWIQAVMLGIFGNLFYYWLLSEAVVRVGAGIAGAFSSVIPVVATIVANQKENQPISWNAIAWPLVMIAAGLALFNFEEFGRLERIDFLQSPLEFAIGILLAAASVAVWTWYPLANAHWLKTHPNLPGSLWVAMQGAGLLPSAVIGLILLPSADAPWHAVDAVFVLWMILLGVGCSWIGNALWNQMSRRLPNVLIGQMLIFETAAAVAYGCLWQGEWISMPAFFGIALQLLGISLTVRLVQHSPQAREIRRNAAASI